jgi:hypothetical protein
MQDVGKKVTGTFCAQHPSGLSGKRCLSPFSSVNHAIPFRNGQEFTVASVGRALLPVAVLTGKSARPTTLIDWPVLS